MSKEVTICFKIIALGGAVALIGGSLFWMLGGSAIAMAITGLVMVPVGVALGWQIFRAEIREQSGHVSDR